MGINTNVPTNLIRSLPNYSVTVEELDGDNMAPTYVLRDIANNRIGFFSAKDDALDMAYSFQSRRDKEVRQERINDLRAAIDEAAGACEDMNLLTMALKVLTRK